MSEFPKGYVDDLAPETIAELRAAIPAHLLEGLDRYVRENIPTGGFLRAVLENDLSGAFNRCSDPSQLTTIKPLLRYFFGCLPAPCWGTSAKVKAWLDTG